METRPITELLQIVKKRYQLEVRKKTNRGLCFTLDNLFMAERINYFEYNELSKYIYNNFPTDDSFGEVQKMAALCYETKQPYLNYFYWSIQDTSARIKWLNFHIKKTKYEADL